MRSKRKKLNRDLLDAVVMCDIAKVQDLLNRGADVDARDDEHCETPLILAAKFADPAIVRLLLNNNAEVDARDDKGRTALFFASLQSEAFKELIEAGANIHARDEEGNTILLQVAVDSVENFVILQRKSPAQLRSRFPPHHRTLDATNRAAPR